MNVDSILTAFPRHSALVVGDICLDRWCSYDAAFTEPSRETGIPRLAIVSTTTTPGAGGTVASNLAALGIGRVAVLGAAGDDGFGYELRRALELRGISPELLVTSADLPTFTYTKLLNADTGEEDQPRVDFICARPLPESVEEQVLERLRDVAPRFDVLLVSDQAETSQGGVITSRVRDLVSRIAAEYPEKVVWVDSRVRPHLFRGVIVKPNEQEAAAASISALGRIDYAAFRRHIGAPALFITQGPRGVIVIDATGERLMEGRPIAKPVDICGAGDSFSAGASVALAATRSVDEAALFGNLVASITIMKKGTGTASPDEVRDAACAAGFIR